MDEKYFSNPSDLVKNSSIDLDTEIFEKYLSVERELADRCLAQEEMTEKLKAEAYHFEILYIQQVSENKKLVAEKSKLNAEKNFYQTRYEELVNKFI